MILNPKYRFFYIISGIVFMAFLAYRVSANFIEFYLTNVTQHSFDNFLRYSANDIIIYSLPSLIFFGCAYKTYPREPIR
jgi:hypothetical protein